MYRRSRLPLLLALLGLCLGAGVARAQTSLRPLGPGDLRELSHKRSLRFGPQVLHVVETIVVGNGAATAAEALYELDLPARAAIAGLQVETATNERSRYGVVDSLAATRFVAEDSERARADMGLVRMIASEGESAGDRKRYELRIFPVPAGKSVTLVLDWSMPVRMVAGNYTVRIPARGEAPELARGEVLVAPSEPMLELYGGGERLAKSAARAKSYRFFAPASGDLVVSGRPQRPASRAQAELALVPLSATSGVAAFRVHVPEGASAPAPALERALIIIDVSTSLGDAGRAAAATLVDSLMSQLSAGTRVEAILFDRKAERVLGRWQAVERSHRAAIVRAIGSAETRNGSDLRAALQLGRRLLEEDGLGATKGSGADASRTLVAIVSDGMLPTGLDGAEALDLLGTGAERPRVLAAVLVPPTAPLPELHRNSLSAMAYQSSGRATALRFAEAEARGKQLLSELDQPAPLHTLEVEFDRGQWVGADLQGTVEPGASITALGYYEGGLPRRITVRARRGGASLSLPVKRVSRVDARALALMTLASTSPDSFPGGEDALASKRAFQRAAASLGVVTQVSAGVALDQSDGFAGDRLALAQRWGGQYYRRVPPAQERGSAEEWQRFAQNTQGAAQRHGTTGQLAGEFVSRRIKAHVIPVARGCYERLLRRDKHAGGPLRLHLEVARGEVHFAEIPRLPLSLEPIRSCILDAVYAMPVPRVRQGDDPELISVASYPLRFRGPKAGKARVEAGKPGVSPGEVDPVDPLSGLPE